MVDIQSPTGEIRRGNKRRRRKKQDENIYGLPYYIGQTINDNITDVITVLSSQLTSQ